VIVTKMNAAVEAAADLATPAKADVRAVRMDRAMAAAPMAEAGLQRGSATSPASLPVHAEATAAAAMTMMTAVAQAVQTVPGVRGARGSMMATTAAIHRAVEETAMAAVRTSPMTTARAAAVDHQRCGSATKTGASDLVMTRIGRLTAQAGHGKTAVRHVAAMTMTIVADPGPAVRVPADSRRATMTTTGVALPALNVRVQADSHREVMMMAIVVRAASLRTEAPTNAVAT
jgi:hypothetical protein